MEFLKENLKRNKKIEKKLNESVKDLWTGILEWFLKESIDQFLRESMEGLER